MSLEDEIKAFQQQFNQNLKPKKTITTSPGKHRKHQHFTQGKTGYKPCLISDPIDIKRAKRGIAIAGIR